MPEICRFYGIVITMNFSEHGPPHFHAPAVSSSSGLPFTKTNFWQLGIGRSDKSSPAGSIPSRSVVHYRQDLTP